MPALSEISSTLPAPSPESTPDRSLQYLLWLAILVPCLALLALGTVRWRQIHHEGDKRVERVLGVASEHTQKILETNEVMLQRVLDLVRTDDDATIKARERELHDLLRSIAANKPQIQSIWVQGPQGRPLVTNRFYPAPNNLDISDREFFKWHQDRRGGLYLTEPLVGRVTNDPFFDLSVGRYRSDGTFAGLVSVGLFPSYFRAFHEQLLASEPGIAVTLLRTDGHIYTRSPGTSLSKFAQSTQTMEILRSGVARAEYRGVSAADGADRKVLLQKVGIYPMYVTASLDLATVRAQWLREMSGYAAFGALPSLALVYAVVLARRRTRQALESGQLLRDEQHARRAAEQTLAMRHQLDETNRQLSASLETLRQGEKKKDEFLATLAHELRNPLAPIRTALLVLDRVAPDDPRVPRMRAMMGRQVEHMVHLVDDLLDLSRISRGRVQLKTERLLLAEVIRSAAEASAHAVEQGGHRLDLEQCAEPLVVQGDSVRLTQVFSNLINNAARYTPEGGQIRITLAREGTQAIVRVQDNGAGIPLDMQQSIFEMFMQVKQPGTPSQAGLGIGLTLVRGLVEQHGGTVQVASEGEGRGSTFTVSLPLVDSGHSVQGPAIAPAQSMAGGLRVLVIDDNRDAAHTLAELLALEGARVQCASDGLQGLETAAAFDPDLILLDLGMPGLDGYKTAARLKERKTRARLVAVTGWGQTEDRRRSAAAGFDAHLVKPVTLLAVNEQLKAALTQGRATALVND